MFYKMDDPQPHSDNAKHVFKVHYYRKDAKGAFLENHPADVFRRVSDFYTARSGNWYNGFIKDHAEDLYDIQMHKLFTFNSPTYYNAYADNNRPLMFACFLGDLKDNMESITYHVGRFAKIFQNGAGIGINIGALRPKGASIGDGGVTISGQTGSSGAVSYMKLYNMTGEIVKSAGKRRAAIMIMINDSHPDLLEFITCKSGPDRRNYENMNISVAVSDKFMQAVVDNEDWNLEWKGTVWHVFKARELWDRIITHAHRTGDPGIFFVDRANEFNPAGMVGLIRCTNPCLTGDTKVAVADGRDYATIKELADKGDDVPVYCLDPNGELTIRTMRHPRVTGYNMPVYKLTLHDGSVIRQTGNHEYMLRDGSYKRVDELQYGDSLRILNKYTPSEEQQSDSNASYADRYKSFSCGGKTSTEHRMIAEFNYGEIPEGHSVHHLNEDRMDNRAENLEIKLDISHLSDHGEAENNGNFSGFSHDDLREHATSLTKKLNRLFSVEEWQAYAQENGLPQRFTQWRIDALGSIPTLAKWAAHKCGMDEFINVDPRVVKTYRKFTAQGYDCDIIDGHVYINKVCKGCEESFSIDWEHREVMYHSVQCMSKATAKQRVAAGAVKKQETIEAKKQQIREQQLDVFTKIACDLGRDPQKKEWVNACKENGVSPEISRKSSPFRTWENLKEAAAVFNHRVVSVKLDGHEDVYNGTVDDFHNFFVGGWESKTKTGRNRMVWIDNVQCGEVCLPPSTSCNLGAVNLYQAALKTEDVRNNISGLLNNIHEVVKVVFPYLDANIDITVYPDKEFEHNTRSIRPIGLGISGLGEMFYHLGMEYGSPESCQLAQDIMEELTLTALEWSTSLPLEYSTPLLRGNEDVVLGVFDRYREASKQKDRWTRIMSRVKDGHLRNLFVTTIAPTGNTGIAMDAVSGGCEPVYALGYRRNLATGGTLDFVDPEFANVAEERGLDVQEVIDNGGTLEGIDVPDDVKKIFVVANDIASDRRVNMQSALQKFTTLSISSTLNVPNETTVQEISDVYLDAWKQKCKGITVFRDGCLDYTPLETSKSHKNGADVKSGVALGDMAQEDIDAKFAGVEEAKNGNEHHVAEVTPYHSHCNRCEIK